LDVSRLNRGEQIAGIAGIALILIMFIFDWFTVSAGSGDFKVSAGGNAWEVFDFIDIILFVAAVSGIALALTAASSGEVNAPVALSAITAGLGILATILVIYRIIDVPDGGIPEGLGVDVGRAIGVWLGLIASAALAYGGWLAMQEEGTTFSTTTTGGAGTPPPPPPPAA
jgi:prepilin signal peptidase PulO-like enzyme (type II secretory pathway)